MYAGLSASGNALLHNPGRKTSFASGAGSTASRALRRRARPRGQLIVHPTLGPVVCKRILRRRSSSSGPPILTIGVRPWDGGHHLAPPEDDENVAPWHDPQYVEALIDQAARQRAFDDHTA